VVPKKKKKKISKTKKKKGSRESLLGENKVFHGGKTSVEADYRC